MMIAIARRKVASTGDTLAGASECCSCAIHDTSSVVGAALQYGREALEVGTTVKLTRALWIVPLVLVAMMLLKPEGLWPEATHQRELHAEAAETVAPAAAAGERG